MTSTTDLDVIIIGGGPAGASLGTLVAKAGHRAALFERRSFPRFHVGESLVPAVNITLEKLGILDRMDGRGFPRKHGVQFYSPKGAGRPFYFSEVDDPRMHTTWQVLRSDFDALLLDNAVDSGLQAFTQVEVLDTLSSNGSVSGVRIRRSDGSEEDISARIVVDATGQRSLVARRFGGHKQIKGLTNASVFAHYEGVELDPGIDAGSTLIFRLEGNSWIWFIPLPEVVSIGLVAPADSIWSLGGTVNEVLETAISSCAPLSERLARAKRTTDVHAVRDYSYRSKRDGGSGWLLVGDALGFIDPIYSTGLLLTMLSAELATKAISKGLASSERHPDLGGFSEHYQTAFDQFLVLVRAFYTEDFHFGRFAKSDAHRQGLIDLLTGITCTPEAIQVAQELQRLV